MKKISWMVILFFVLQNCYSQSSGDYRTKMSGYWRSANIWETFNGTNWVNATNFPTMTNGEIHVLNGHVVSFQDPNQLYELNLDQLVVDFGGEILSSQADTGIWIINDGPGVDMTINGKVSIYRLSSSSTATAVINTTGEFISKSHVPSLVNYGKMKAFRGFDLIFWYGIVNNGIIETENNVEFWVKTTFVNNGTINVNYKEEEYQYGPAELMIYGGTMTNNGIININPSCELNNLQMEFINAINGKINLLNSRIICGSSEYANTGTFKNYGVIEGTNFGLDAINEVTNYGTIKGKGSIYVGDSFSNLGLVKTHGILTSGGLDENQLLNANSTIEIEINNDSGIGNGRFERSNDFIVAGTLIVTETGSVPDGIYTIAQAELGELTGTFSTLNLPPGYTILYNRKYIQVIKGSPPANTNNYRSKNSGQWTNPSNWERFNGINWVTASIFPDNTANEIRILSGHTINFEQNYLDYNGKKIDQFIVDQGAVLNINSDFGVDNSIGNDFIINGTVNVNEFGSITSYGETDSFNSGTTMIINATGVVNLFEGQIVPNTTNNGIINLIGDNKTTYLEKPFINNGKIILLSTGYNFYGQYEFLNSSTGEIILNHGKSISFGGYNIGGDMTVGLTFNNYGIIKGNGTTHASFFSRINNYGTFSPGLNIGKLGLSSSPSVGGTALPFTPTSHLKIDIQNGDGEGIGHDQFTISGNLPLNGQLTVSEIGGAPLGSYIIAKATSGTISGTFSSVSLPFGYNIQYNSTTVVVNKTINSPCSSSLALASPTDDYSLGTIYKEANATTGTITATNKITNSANVTYRAGKSITLNAGFKADNGVVFKTEFGGCN